MTIRAAPGLREDSSLLEGNSRKKISRDGRWNVVDPFAFREEDHVSTVDNPMERTQLTSRPWTSTPTRP